MVRIRERLTHTVIRDGDGRHAPLCCLLYDVGHLRHSVHIAHLRVAVKLNPLYLRVVHPLCGKIRYLFYAAHRADGNLLAPTVHRDNTLDFYKCTILYIVLDFIEIFLGIKENLDRHGIRKIRDGECHKLLARPKLLNLNAPYPASDNTLSYLVRYRGKLNRLIVKILAVYDIGISRHLHGTEALCIVLCSRSLFVRIFYVGSQSARNSLSTLNTLLLCSGIAVFRDSVSLNRLFRCHLTLIIPVTALRLHVYNRRILRLVLNLFVYHVKAYLKTAAVKEYHMKVL